MEKFLWVNKKGKIPYIGWWGGLSQIPIETFKIEAGIKFPKKYEFSEKERKSLERILSRFDKAEVERFVYYLSFNVALYIHFKGASVPKSDIEKHMLPDLKGCRATLEKILECFNPSPPRDFDSMRALRLYRGETFRNLAFVAAKKAYPHVKNLEKILKEALIESKKEGGRPRADKTGFVCSVAKLYELVFDRKPAESKNGIFHKLISELFNILDPRPDRGDRDPSRSIQRAFEKLRSHHLKNTPSD